MSLRRRGWTLVLLCFVLGAAIVVPACLKPAGIRYPGLPGVSDGALHIINFDVGQADALLVIYRGKSMLVDCGSPMRAPNKPIRQIPRRLDALLGTRHIDYFVVTHYHQDHVGAPGNQPNRRDPMGIYALIERKGVTIGTLIDRGFWFIGEPGATQRHYESYSKRWLATGVAQTRRVVGPGDTIDMGEGLEVTVVSASGNGLLGQLQSMFPTFMQEARPSENDYSVGLKITHGDFEMFTAGDLSGKNVLRQYGPVRESYTDIESRVSHVVGPVEVYRVNHHGSRHSTNPCFGQVLRPQVSVFSTGVNRYGHPDPDVVERLDRYGDIYITGGVDPTLAHRIDPSFVVGDDVEILVQPGGARFWVNGKPYVSLSDAEELARPLGEEDLCAQNVNVVRPEDYEVDTSESSGD